MCSVCETVTKPDLVTLKPLNILKKPQNLSPKVVRMLTLWWKKTKVILKACIRPPSLVHTPKRLVTTRLNLEKDQCLP